MNAALSMRAAASRQARAVERDARAARRAARASCAARSSSRPRASARHCSCNVGPGQLFGFGRPGGFLRGRQLLPTVGCPSTTTRMLAAQSRNWLERRDHALMVSW